MEKAASTALKRAAVFAHYDREGRIEDYVVYYLSELKKVAGDIVFVSDSSLLEGEEEKISDIAVKIIAKPHGEYDFGSYKRGYFYLKENGLLDGASELIFANDSCYGPLYPFDKVFKGMEGYDFWGMNFNDIDVLPHLQSFFVTFSASVFKSECFNNFMESIGPEANKDDIIEKYEIGMSKTLANNGFKMGAFIKSPIDREISGGMIFKKENPLIKTCAMDRAYGCFVKAALGGLNYPKSLILQAGRYKRVKKSFLKNFNFLRKIFIKIHTKRREVYLFGNKFNF